MRVLVVLVSVSALLITALGRESETRAHNDGDPGQSGTHYVKCVDGNGSRWPYTNYSEQQLNVVSRFGQGVPQLYKDTYIDAAVRWNMQPTRVSFVPGTAGPNTWNTSWAIDGTAGFIRVHCSSGSPLSSTVVTEVFLNRYYLDANPALRRHTALHELGHQGSAGHSKQWWACCALAVMLLYIWQCVVQLAPA